VTTSFLQKAHRKIGLILILGFVLTWPVSLFATDQMNELKEELTCMVESRHKAEREGNLEAAIGIMEDYIRLYERSTLAVFQQTVDLTATKLTLPAMKVRAAKLQNENSLLRRSIDQKCANHWLFLLGFCFLLLFDGSLIYQIWDPLHP
jgi:hypothetical protein